MQFKLLPELKTFLSFFSLIPLLIYYTIRNCMSYLLPSEYRHKKDISGQTILITGAGSGIGRELAIKFSNYSTRLVLLDLNQYSLSQTQKLLNNRSKSFLFECDVSKREKVYETAKTIKKEVGKVDILVNNAGIVSGKMFLDLSDDEILRTIEVNTLAHFWLLKAFLPAMIESNKGHIISIASQAGLSGIPSLTDYCASKFAAVGLMESLQFELESKELNGIHTTVVCPNLISTGLFEGTKTTVCSVLTPEMVAREIINGILENETRIMIPKWTSIIFIFKALMPMEITTAFVKQIGLMDCMKSFTGRSKSDTNGNAHQEDGPISRP